MKSLVCGLLLLLTLPSCVVALGNTGYGGSNLPPEASPLLQEKIDAARRVVELQQRRLDTTRTAVEAGRVPTEAAIDAEVQVEEAKIRLIQYRADKLAVDLGGKKD